MTNLLMGLEGPNKDSKSLERIYDPTYNPTTWVKCIHHFDLSHKYSYTDIFYLNGTIRKICIIDSNGKINPNYDLTGTSTACNIRRFLYDLIADSYTEFNQDLIIKRVIEHPYLNAEYLGTVTTRIEMISVYQGNLTEEQQFLVNTYKAEQERIKKEIEKKRDDKKLAFIEASKYDCASVDCDNIPTVLLDGPFVNSDDFYSKIKLNGIHISFNNFIVTHSYIDSIKAAFKEFNPSRYDIDIKWQMNVENPSYYRYGVNQTTKDFNEKFYIYYNDKVIKNFFSDNMKLGKSISWKLYYWTIGLLYINNRLNEETNLDDIFYFMMCFIEKYFIQNNVHVIQEVNEANRNDIKMMSIEKLISNIKQYQREIDILDVLNFVRGKTKNGCLFPKGWTAEQKREWKENNNIERRERKDKGGKHMFKKGTTNQSKIGMKYKKQLDIELLTKILELRKEGKTFKEISNVMDIPKSTIIRLYKKVETDLEN